MTFETGIKDQEMEAVEQLRKRLKEDMDPEMYEDVYMFHRFLKARDFNIDNAETMLRKHLVWREKNDVKNIMEFKKTELMEKYIPYVFLGYDKEGCVIRYSDGGNIDVKGVMSSFKFEDLSKLMIYETELDTIDLKKQSKKLGKNIDKCIYIHNLEHFSLAKATDKKALYCLLFMMNFYVNNYPERLKAAYILNASMYFHIIFAALKRVLPQTIINKLHLYSDDSYKEDLLKVVDADVLPAFLGGNRTDPDGNPLCLTFVKRGQLIPESYYINQCKQSLAKAEGVQKVTLTRAAFHEVKLEVKEPGSYLEWEFETKCRDIGFGLFYEELIDGEEKVNQLIPIERIDTELFPETGTIQCELPGTYVIVFDNTYSWIRDKQVYYRTKLVTPEEHESAHLK